MSSGAGWSPAAAGAELCRASCSDGLPHIMAQIFFAILQAAGHLGGTAADRTEQKHTLLDPPNMSHHKRMTAKYH